MYILSPFVFVLAPLPPPTNLMVIETLGTSISLSWTQSEGADAVDRYEISYSLTINGCLELGTTSRGSIDAGSVTTYTLVDSGSNPIEEDSVYDISVRAVNSVAMSDQAKTTATTPRAGLLITLDTCCSTNGIFYCSTEWTTSKHSKHLH